MTTRFALFEGHIREGAPEIPLILAITYPDHPTMTAEQASPQRALAKAATEALLERLFTGRIHHHITEAFETHL